MKCLKPAPPIRNSGKKDGKQAQASENALLFDPSGAACMFRHAGKISGIGIFSAGFKKEGIDRSSVEYLSGPVKSTSIFDLVFVAVGESERPFRDEAGKSIPEYDAKWIPLTFIPLRVITKGTCGGAPAEYEGKLYLVTSNKKPVFARLKADNRAVICGMTPGRKRIRDRDGRDRPRTRSQSPHAGHESRSGKIVQRG